jgi:hypothetical protein
MQIAILKSFEGKIVHGSEAVENNDRELWDEDG